MQNSTTDSWYLS